MKSKTYDRNATKGVDLLTNDDHRKIPFVNIVTALSMIEDAGFKTLRDHHQAARGLIGRPRPEFKTSEWIRYCKHLKINYSDASITHHSVINVLEASRQSGYSHITFATQVKSGS